MYLCTPCECLRLPSLCSEAPPSNKTEPDFNFFPQEWANLIEKYPERLLTKSKTWSLQSFTLAENTNACLIFRMLYLYKKLKSCSPEENDGAFCWTAIKASKHLKHAGWFALRITVGETLVQTKSGWITQKLKLSLPSIQSLIF